MQSPEERREKNRIRSKRWHRNNKKRAVAYARRYAKANLEKIREANRRRYWENHEEQLTRRRRWNRSPKGKASKAAWKRKDRRKHPEAYRSTERLRREKRRLDPDWIRRRKQYERTWIEKNGGLDEVRRLYRERMRHSRWGGLWFVRERVLQLEKEIRNAK